MAVYGSSFAGIEAWAEFDDVAQGDEAMAAGSIGGTEINGGDQAECIPKGRTC